MEENDNTTEEEEIIVVNNNSSNNKKQDSTDSLESNDSAKRMKTDDSGISVDVTTSGDEVKNDFTVTDHTNSASTSTSYFSGASGNNSGQSVSIEDKDNVRHNDVSANLTETINQVRDAIMEQAINEVVAREENTSNIVRGVTRGLWSISSSGENSPDEDHGSESMFSDSDMSDIEDPPVLSKEKPKHKWFMVPEVLNRQLGRNCKYNSSELFQRRCYGSLHAVQRLELMYKLEKHEGCVNSLNFHPNGALLASGSDDFNCVIWDWPLGKPLITFNTKHKGNVFQSKFMNLSGDLHVVTSARDGHVKLHQISKTDGWRSTRRLGSHKGPVNKVALLTDQPHVVLSSGEDGCVYSHDVRSTKPVKLLTVQNMDDRRIALYSISSHPLDSHQFCVSGRDHLVRIYDQRKISPVLNSFYPGHMKKKSDLLGLHVTCAIYNHNGTEILASYSDDDIYLFDTTTTATNNSYVHCYQGHRNGATIKGVNFFGPKSEYIVSGSDCGHLFFWDKSTEAIVQFMLADDSGVVNCLEPHPQLPIICTSGLDWDVKVWVPSHEHEPEMAELATTVRRNYRCRQNERVHSSNDINDSQMLWMLWRHLRTSEHLRRFGRRQRQQHRQQQQQQQQPNESGININEDGTITITPPITTASSTMPMVTSITTTTTTTSATTGAATTITTTLGIEGRDPNNSSLAAAAADVTRAAAAAVAAVTAGESDHSYDMSFSNTSIDSSDLDEDDDDDDDDEDDDYDDGPPLTCSPS